MLAEILRFELFRHLRALSTRIYLFLFAALGFLWMTAAGGALPNASVRFGGGKVFINGPYILYESISVMTCFGLLVISAIAGRAAYQDFDQQTHSFFFTSPISKRAYLGGRFLAAVIVLLIIFSAIAPGLWLATFLPNMDQQLLGPNHFIWYVQPYQIIAFPNVLDLERALLLHGRARPPHSTGLHGQRHPADVVDRRRLPRREPQESPARRTPRPFRRSSHRPRHRVLDHL